MTVGPDTAYIVRPLPAHTMVQEVQRRIPPGGLSATIACLSLYDTTGQVLGAIEEAVAQAAESDRPHVCRSRTFAGVPISGGCDCSGLCTERRGSSSGLGLS